MDTGTQPDTRIERLLRHDRAIVIAALAIVVVGCWLYLLAGAGTGMSTLDMTSWQVALGVSNAMAVPVDWTPGYAWVMLVMWWIMMIAMMTPSATPMILLHARITRQAAESRGTSGVLPTASFMAGYVLAWGLFSLVATGLQWAFESLGVLSPMMMSSTSQVFAGVVLLFAGAYQLTPLKQACLRHCRSPLSFVMNNWREGHMGALRMGLEHGAYCLGCCWGLMAILFFGGIMNLYWIVALALLVLAEKVAAVGPALSRLTGALLVIWGASFLWRAAIG